jgi:hypothetical protein
MVHIVAFIKSGSFGRDYSNGVKSEFSSQTVSGEEVLKESDILHLPVPVRKYVIYSGAIGQRKPQNVRIAFNAKMFRKPGAIPMMASSEQYNFYGNYARLFLMKARMLLIPFHAFHTYRNQEATFKVRVANLVNVVDVNGADLTTTETVTLLNDMCVFVPGNLCDKRLTWKEIDSLSCEVTLENGKYKVSAILYFNEKGELINFVSDDRAALQEDGTLRRARWSTPMSDYKELDGRRIPTYGETIWNYPEGDFTYGTFRLKNIKYNVPCFESVNEFR